MRFSSVTPLLAVALLLPACSAPDAGSSAGGANIVTENDRGSYALGFDMGEALRGGSGVLEIDALVAGIEDGMVDQPQLSNEVRQLALRDIMTKIRNAQAGITDAMAEENLNAGRAFLAQNAEREEVSVTESGLQYQVLEEGDGPSPTMEDQVRVHYRGTLIDGTEFDSSLGGEPVVFPAGGLIDGFSEALTMMQEGARWRVWIPANLAYGAEQRGEIIEPNSVLVFEIELIEVLE